VVTFAAASEKMADELEEEWGAAGKSEKVKKKKM